MLENNPRVFPGVGKYPDFHCYPGGKGQPLGQGVLILSAFLSLASIVPAFAVVPASVDDDIDSPASYCSLEIRLINNEHSYSDEEGAMSPASDPPDPDETKVNLGREDRWSTIILRPPEPIDENPFLVPDLYNPEFHADKMDRYDIPDSWCDLTFQDLENGIILAQADGDLESELSYRRSLWLDTLRCELATNHRTGFISPIDDSFQCLVDHTDEFYEGISFLHNNPGLYEGLNCDGIFFDPYRLTYRAITLTAAGSAEETTARKWYNHETRLHRCIEGRNKDRRNQRKMMQMFFRTYNMKSFPDALDPHVAATVRWRVSNMINTVLAKEMDDAEEKECLLMIALGLADASLRCADGVSNSLDDLEDGIIYDLGEKTLGQEISRVLYGELLSFINMHGHPGYRKHNNLAYQEHATEIVMGIRQRLRLLFGLNVPFQTMVHPHLAHLENPAFSMEALLRRFFEGGRLAYHEWEDGREVVYSIDFQGFTPHRFIELLQGAYTHGKLTKLQEYIDKNDDILQAFTRVFVTFEDEENAYFKLDDDPMKAYQPFLFRRILTEYKYLTSS